MDDRDIRREGRAERVQGFGTQNQTDWPAASEPTQRLANITQLLGQLGHAKVGQVRIPASVATLIDALRSDFKDLARTARSIALDEPGFAAPYRVPDTATEEATKTHADALLALLEDNHDPVADGGDTLEQLTAKAALRKKFTDKFLAADFVEDLRADRDAIDALNTARNDDNSEGIKSTAELEIIFTGLATEITHLDALMHNIYKTNPAQLIAWQRASRVERAPKKKKTPPTDPPATPPTNPEPPK